MGSILARIPLVGHLFRHVDPTSEDVVEFWKAMQHQYATTRIDKANSAEMKIVAELLGLLGVLDKKAFLEKYTTTIGDKIYAPFTPGVPTADWSLWSQIAVCVHEHHHVYQDRAAGGLRFEWDYITSSAKRAHYEAEAYRTNMVMEWKYQGRMINPLYLAKLLANYGCSISDIEVAEKMLRLSMPAIKQGAIASDVCRWATIWLDKRWGPPNRVDLEGEVK
jgi:hypothetical protein